MRKAGHHLAELNIGRLIAPTDDPRVADFINNIDRINGLGKRMPGFVWIMESGDGAGNTDTAIAGDPQLIPNLTVWEDSESLTNFVYNTLHDKFLARRAEWFEPAEQEYFVMWWVPEGHRPSIDEALQRLDMLREHGDSEEAFGWSYLKEKLAAVSAQPEDVT